MDSCNKVQDNKVTISTLINISPTVHYVRIVSVGYLNVGSLRQNKAYCPHKKCDYAERSDRNQNI